LNLKYFPELNALRGIAALMVLFFHFMPNVDAHLHPVIHLLYKIAVFGQTGVTLFFVLSGFLITRILLYTKRSEQYFAGFYIKRALRIFPLYYLALAVFFVILPVITGTPEYGNGSWMYWIYLQNFADTFRWKSSGPPHFWSLAVEEHFYLFWPIVVYYSSKRQLVRPIIIIILLAFICRLVLIYLCFGTFYFTFSIMDALAMGAFLAWLEAENKLQAVNFNYIIIISLLLLIPSWLYVGGKGSAIVQIIKFPVIALFYAGIIGKLITEKSWFSRLFLFAPLNYTGKISYGMYVFHPMCFMVYNYFFPGNSIIVNFLSCVMITYIVATVSFYAYEVHFIKLKRHFEPVKWRKELESES
jgi:peptidoglycan/LPS O-acetylase OafA/YrhL